MVVPLLAVVTVAGCSNSETGEASPELGSSSAAALPSQGGVDDSGSGGESVETIEPCELLEDGELSRYGEFGPGEYRTYGSGRNCRWVGLRDAASEDVPIVDVVIEDNAGIDVLPDLGGGLTEGAAASGREIVRTYNETGCVVAMAVGANARVDISVAEDDLQSACDLVDELVDIVDQRLPLG
jgi:hypothetical protein